jgi:hypothetical protein
MNTISMNLTEFFSGGDWEENQHSPQELRVVLGELQKHILGDVYHIRDKIDIVEFVFKLFIQGKPRKSMFLKDAIMSHFHTVYRNRQPPINGDFVSIYDIYFYNHNNKTVTLDSEGISEFVVFLNGFNMKPSASSKMCLNKDIIAFLEL